MRDRDQLRALRRIHELLESHGIEYWVFGGWAIDFHAGRVTRAHEDLDIAVWQSDLDSVAALLEGGGWTHVPEEDEDGYTVFERRQVRLEVALLARDDEGVVFTPLLQGHGEWPGGAFGDDIAQLEGVRARVVTLAALRLDKREPHEDPRAAEKDRADLGTLDAL